MLACMAIVVTVVSVKDGVRVRYQGRELGNRTETSNDQPTNSSFINSMIPTVYASVIELRNILFGYSWDL